MELTAPHPPVRLNDNNNYNTSKGNSEHTCHTTAFLFCEWNCVELCFPVFTCVVVVRVSTHPRLSKKRSQFREIRKTTFMVVYHFPKYPEISLGMEISTNGKCAFHLLLATISMPFGLDPYLWKCPWKWNTHIPCRNRHVIRGFDASHFDTTDVDKNFFR